MNISFVKKSLFTSIAACTIVAVGSGAAWAQSQSQSSGGQNDSGGQQNSAWSKAQSQDFFRASDINGRSVQDRQGQKIGSIKDIVFNKEGDIFALVNIGHDRLAVVPWDTVRMSSAAGNQNLVVNTTGKDVMSGPAVNKNSWGPLDNPNFVQGVYSYYHIQAPSAKGGASPASGSGQGNESSGQKPSQK